MTWNCEMRSKNGGLDCERCGIAITKAALAEGGYLLCPRFSDEYHGPDNHLKKNEETQK